MYHPTYVTLNIRKVTDTKRRTLFPEERSENYMRAVSGVISAPMSQKGKESSEADASKDGFENELCQRLQVGYVDGQRAQLDIGKHGD